jgi:stalled ribosome alternative rescue factor ArfA
MKMSETMLLGMWPLGFFKSIIFDCLFVKNDLSVSQKKTTYSRKQSEEWRKKYGFLTERVIQAHENPFSSFYAGVGSSSS